MFVKSISILMLVYLTKQDKMEQNLTNSAQALQVIHPDTGLTALQEKCCLLLAAGIRITDAALQVGASRGTLYRWLQQPAFWCYLNQAKKEVKEYVEGSLLNLHQKALEGIEASLDSQREDLRLKAATWVLEKIQEMPVGASDIRKVLLEEARLKPSSVDIWDKIGRESEIERNYQKALADAGLEE